MTKSIGLLGRNTRSHHRTQRSSMNIDTINDTLERAINALGLAKIAIRKSGALDTIGSSDDVIRKATTTPAFGPDEIALTLIEDANARLDAVEERYAAEALVRRGARQDMDAQHSPRKTFATTESTLGHMAKFDRGGA
jgi:hypothetical protein